MASNYKAIDGYRVWYYGKNAHHIYVQVYNAGVYQGSLTFRDTTTLPDNSFDAAGHVRLSFRKEDYPHVMDVLRNEKPLFIWLNDANLIGGLATDSTEPVGEGEK